MGLERCLEIPEKASVAIITSQTTLLDEGGG